jgi:hypothetical protein
MRASQLTDLCVAPFKSSFSFFVLKRVPFPTTSQRVDSTLSALYVRPNAIGIAIQFSRAIITYDSSYSTGSIHGYVSLASPFPLTGTFHLSPFL